MGRLTKRDNSGYAYYPTCFREDTCSGKGSSKKCLNCSFEYEMAEKLASYEDIIDDPEKLKRIDELYLERCEEINRLRAELAEIRKQTVDELVKEALKQFAEFDLKHGYPTVGDCKIILRDTAEKLKEVQDVN